MNIAELLGKPLDKKLYREDLSLISNDDAVGVELELENIHYYRNDSSRNYPPIFDMWNAVEDGSLRNGTEMIFKDAFKGANITAALNVMSDFLAVYRYPDNNEPVHITERCSVHVHCDVRDMNEKQLNNMILIYMLVERVLFAHVNPLRLKNNYCRPLTDSNFKSVLLNMLKYNDENKLPHLAQVVRRDCDKYSALNVLPITRYGSVEFRHHHGTTDMAKVKEWINIILSIKVAARNHDIKDLLELYKERGPYKLVKAICNGTVLDNKGHLDNIDEFEDLVRKGVNDVTEIIISDKLQALLPKGKSRAKPENALINKFKEVNNISSSTDFIG